MRRLPLLAAALLLAILAAGAVWFVDGGRTPMADPASAVPSTTPTARFVNIRRQALTPAQRDEADRLTAQLYAAHYAGRPLVRNERRRDLLYTIHAGVGAGAAARADECQANSGRTDER